MAGSPLAACGVRPHTLFAPSASAQGSEGGGGDVHGS
jgi:hypothetical protein